MHERLLVTGFGPFGKDTVNPSGLVAAKLGGLVLPVAADEAWRRVRAEVAVRRPRFVLALGVAGGRAHVCVEKCAVNAAAYPIPDDDGALHHGPLDERLPHSAARSPGLPAAELARAIRRSGVAARVSTDAGRYVCNHFYWHLLHGFAGRAAFLHVPRLPEVEAAHGGKGPSLPLEATERAVLAAARWLERRGWLAD